MKKVFFLSILLSISFARAQNDHDHSHDTKPSNAREMWGDFNSGELIKPAECDWKNSPFGKKIF